MDDLEAEVKKLMNREGVDVAFDTVGTQDTIRMKVVTTKANVGQVVLYGWLDAVTGTDMSETGSAQTPYYMLIKSVAIPRTNFWFYRLQQ